MHAKLALCGKKKTLPEKCLLSVFERDMQQSTKSRTITLNEKKTNLYEEFAFVFLTPYITNVKTHEKQTLWRNRITLPKTCILSVF